MRTLFTSVEKICDGTRDDLLLDTRTHEVHFDMLGKIRRIAVKSRREAAEKQAGINSALNTEFVEQCAVNCPHQWSQVLPSNHTLTV